MLTLFRPGLSTPLDPAEDRQWEKMQSMGRARFIAKRAVWAGANTILLVAIPVWSLWWTAPGVREHLRGPAPWLWLGLGATIVGSFGAANAWATWRNLEKRSEIDDDRSAIEAVHAMLDRSGRYSVLTATVSTAAVVLLTATGAKPWLIGLMSVSSLLAWRSVYAAWRFRRSRVKPHSKREILK